MYYIYYIVYIIYVCVCMHKSLTKFVNMPLERAHIYMNVRINVREKLLYPLETINNRLFQLDIGYKIFIYNVLHIWICDCLHMTKLVNFTIRFSHSLD